MYKFISDFINGKELDDSAYLHLNIYFDEVTNKIHTEKDLERSKLLEMIHLKMGHRSISAIKKMLKMNVLRGFDSNYYEKIKDCEIGTCHGCVTGNMKSSHIGHADIDNKDYKPFEVISLDPIGPVTPESSRHNKYGLILADYKCTKYAFGEYAKNKKQMFTLFKKIMNRIETMGYKVRRIQTDPDSIYVKSDKFLNYCHARGIELTNSTRDAKELNGFIEREIQEFQNKTRVNLYHFNCPKKFWDYCMDYVIHNHNNQLHHGLTETPSKLALGKEFNYQFAAPFYAEVYYRNAEPDRSGKWAEKALLGRFLGYSGGPEGDIYLVKAANGQVIRRKHIIVDKSYLVLHPGIEIEHEDEVEEIDDQELDFGKETDLGEQEDNDEEVEFVRKVKNLLFSPKSFDEIKGREDEDKWIEASKKELQQMLDRKVFDLVDDKESLPKDLKLLNSKMVYQLMEDNEGNLKYKARLVAGGYGQILGLNYDTSYSPTVQFKTLCVIYLLAKWLMLVMAIYDIVGAYLDAVLKKKQLMKLPKDLFPEEIIVIVNKAIYGLHQSGKEFYDTLKDILINHCHFNCSYSDKCLFFKKVDGKLVILCIYVDDLIFFGSSLEIINSIVGQIAEKVTQIKKVEIPRKYLGIYFENIDDNHILLNQKKHIEELNHEDYQVENMMDIEMPFNNTVQSEIVKRNEEEGIIKAHDIIGSLRFLLKTRPDFSVHLGLLSSRAESLPHYYQRQIKRIIKYLKSTSNYGLLLGAIPGELLKIIAYVDASYLSEVKRNSRYGYAIFMNDNSGAVITKSKKIDVACTSPAAAEFRGIFELVKELKWLKGLLDELDIPYDPIFEIRTDSKICIDIIEGNSNTEGLKHLLKDLDYVKQEFNRDERHSEDGQLWNKWLHFKFINSGDNIADILTKAINDKENYKKLVKQLLYGLNAS